MLLFCWFFFVLKQRASDITVTCHQGRAVLLSIKINVQCTLRYKSIYYFSLFIWEVSEKLRKFILHIQTKESLFKHMYLHALLTDCVFEYTCLNIQEFLPFGLNNSTAVKRSLTKFNSIRPRSYRLYPNKFKNSVFDVNVIMAPIMAFFIQKRASIQ